MKKETYAKAMEKHEQKLIGYGERLSDLIYEMGNDDCSVVEIVGILEAEKGRLLDVSRRASAIEELLGCIADGEEE